MLLTRVASSCDDDDDDDVDVYFYFCWIIDLLTERAHCIIDYYCLRRVVILYVNVRTCS
jgi:hypothetical protein